MSGHFPMTEVDKTKEDVAIDVEVERESFLKSQSVVDLEAVSLN